MSFWPTIYSHSAVVAGSQPSCVYGKILSYKWVITGGMAMSMVWVWRGYSRNHSDGGCEYCFIKVVFHVNIGITMRGHICVTAGNGKIISSMSYSDIYTRALHGRRLVIELIGASAECWYFIVLLWFIMTRVLILFGWTHFTMWGKTTASNNDQLSLGFPCGIRALPSRAGSSIATT